MDMVMEVACLLSVDALCYSASSVKYREVISSPVGTTVEDLTC